QAEIVGRETRLINLTLFEKRDAAWGTFALRPGDAAYRLLVWDEDDFANVPPPQRSIRIVPQDPPTVALLREEFPPSNDPSARPFAEDFEVDGMPVPVGGRMRIAYSCSGAYGIGRAQLVYRVLRKSQADEDQQPKGSRWVTLPLVEVASTDKAGPFLV